MTVDMCLGLAKAKNLTYAALQAGMYCFGGMDISMYTITGTCSSLCKGNGYTMCGGSCANDIYLTGEVSFRIRVGAREGPGDAMRLVQLLMQWQAWLCFFNAPTHLLSTPLVVCCASRRHLHVSSAAFIDLLQQCQLGASQQV